MLFQLSFDFWHVSRRLRTSTSVRSFCFNYLLISGIKSGILRAWLCKWLFQLSFDFWWITQEERDKRLVALGCFNYLLISGATDYRISALPPSCVFQLSFDFWWRISGITNSWISSIMFQLSFDFWRSRRRLGVRHSRSDVVSTIF